MNFGSSSSTVYEIYWVTWGHFQIFFPSLKEEIIKYVTKLVNIKYILLSMLRIIMGKNV